MVKVLTVDEDYRTHKNTRPGNTAGADSSGRGVDRLKITPSSTPVKLPYRADRAGAEAVAATTLDEQYAALRELNTYGIEQFWQLWALVGPQFNLAQPWVAGYNGEALLGRGAFSVVFTRLWFDSSLKP